MCGHKTFLGNFIGILTCGLGPARLRGEVTPSVWARAFELRKDKVTTSKYS